MAAVMTLAERETQLKEKYIELLEKRVAQLEIAVQTGSKPRSPDEAKEKDTQTDDNGKNNGSNGDASINRYRYTIRKWNNSTGSYEDKEMTSDSTAKQPSQGIAYTFRRVYDSDGGEKDAYSEVDIEDEALIRILRETIDKYPGVNFDGDVVNMVAPFAPLVHNWDLFHEKVRENPKVQAWQDLEHLLQRISQAREVAHYFKMRDVNAVSHVTTYETLWTEFAPNTLIVASPFMGHEQILRVSSAPIPFTRRPRSYINMSAWCWDWDGKKMVKVTYLLRFDRFHGTKPIAELPYFPLRYHESEAELRQLIHERADKFLKATIFCKKGAGQMFEYNDNAYRDKRKVINEPEEDENDENEESPGRGAEQDSLNPKRIPIKGRIISDAQSFLQYSGGNHPLGDLTCTYSDQMPFEFNDLLMAQIKTAPTLEEAKDLEKTPVPETKKDVMTEAELNENMLLLPPRILGFATTEKMWAQFIVSSAQEAGKKDPDPFDKDLQLKQEYKDLINALVGQHEAAQEKPQSQINDIVDGKGKGLVLLLHGPPGVGKTLTAETIAKKTGKPLFVVSVAEIGLNAAQAERNLEKLFKLATKWEAILLVDEADVFLETRGSTSSATRNALVSVLLRVLEYYRGIIILTTNRIKSIDIAVISRIHLAIQYTDLDAGQTEKVFQYFFSQLEPHMIRDGNEIRNYISMISRNIGLNGRQIRNVVMCARAKALEDARRGAGDGRLSLDNLKQVCNITQDFQDQLKEHVRDIRWNNEIHKKY